MRHRKIKKVGSSMGTVLRFKAAGEKKHWQSCAGCRRRFSEEDMVWIDTQGWLCSNCQKWIS